MSGGKQLYQSNNQGVWKITLECFSIVKAFFITVISENEHQQIKKSTDFPSSSPQKTMHNDSGLQTW